VFISESHYLIPLLDRLQYDTVYHEHLRYYSLASLKHLLEMHGLEVFHARPIPSHGGSIRVYAAKKGTQKVQDSVAKMLAAEPRGDAMAKRLADFRKDVVLSKLQLPGDALVDTLSGGETVKPWPWADTWPIARLSAPRHGVDLFVLAGATGRTLAFGPGHVDGTARPGRPGCSHVSTAGPAGSVTPVIHGKCRG
jgi:hypothetical protein